MLGQNCDMQDETGTPSIPDAVAFRVDPVLKAVLLEAIAACDRGEKISAQQLLQELQAGE
jgi:hypothetical protein